MSLILPQPKTQAFSSYRPSTNAHVDILSQTAQGKRPQSSKTTRTKPSPKDQLQTLTTSIPLLLSGKPPQTTYHHLSSTCRDLVSPPHTLGPTIYSAIKDELKKSVGELERAWRRSIMAREGGWLERFVGAWKVWQKRVMTVSAIFVYLDRVYSNEGNGIASIADLAIEIFRQGAWDNQLLFDKTKDDFLGWVSSEREANQPNTTLRPTISSLIILSKTLSSFQTLYSPYLSQSTEHYSHLVPDQMTKLESSTLKATSYVAWTIDEHSREVSRAQFICGSNDGDVKRAEKIYLDIAGKDVSDKFVRRALDEAMDEKDEIALTRLYTICVLSDVFSTMSKALQDHIETRLRTLISDPANDPMMIESTLNLKRFTDKSIKSLHIVQSTITLPKSITDVESSDRTTAMEVEETALPAGEGVVISGGIAGGDGEMSRKTEMELEEAVRNGFKLGMGSRQNAPAEWIAKHLDATMRKGQGSGTESQFNTLLDEIIALIGYTKDKDVFKAFYSTGLAKRLLLNKSASDDMERNMILKLQKEMGEEFTSGDIMMKDLQLSETLVKSYQSARAKGAEQFKDDGNLTANVLTESAWPPYPLLKEGWDFKLPPPLQNSIDAFTTWYSTQHKNRKLSWRYQLATVTMSARFGATKYEIGVSLFQAVCLMQFNDEDGLSFKDIRERTGIESSELIRTLQSLSMGRKGTRVLVKKPPGKEVDPSDMFMFNKAFSSERLKFKINQIQQDLSAEESRKTNEQIAIDRVSVLEATIVRIMKARKKMTLQLLIDAVVTAANKHFPPDVKEIKKRMESLIEREFLMRDEEDRNLLHYLA